jgi:nucleoporin NUP1
MASSSSMSSKDGHQAPPKLARHNSSFLGAIKTIVTAPFSWFGNAEGEADVTGSKRRRPGSVPAPTVASCVQEAPTEIIIEKQRSSSSGEDQDERTRRSKRMRLNSPPRTMKSTTRRSSVVPRASSAVLPSSRGASRATLSPKRNTKLYPPTVQRTMSIDPPQLASRRNAIPSTSFNFGVDVDMVGLDTRDISMAPPSRLSPRPSFRMRASMTPQPVQHALPQRHISEPPPLNALFSNPVFVHPPLQEKEATPIPAPVPTLGTLMDSRNVSSQISQFWRVGIISFFFSGPFACKTSTCFSSF